MRAIGRRVVALVGLSGTMALWLCVAAAGYADTLKTEVELTTKDMGSKETAMGDLVADAIRTVAKADAAFIPASCFSETPITISKGNFMTADLLKAIEFKSANIGIVKLTGDQIMKALEHGLHLYPRANSSFLQFSGLTVTIKPDAPDDKRVMSVKINGDTLDTGKTYKVAMPMSLANGALGYFKVWKKGDIEKDTEKSLEKALTEYLNDHKTITKSDERLVVKGK